MTGRRASRIVQEALETIEGLFGELDDEDARELTREVVWLLLEGCPEWPACDAYREGRAYVCRSRVGGMICVARSLAGRASARHRLARTIARHLARTTPPGL